MKTVVTVSLGSSKQDYAFETDFLGQHFSVQRYGADDDTGKAWELMRREQARAEAAQRREGDGLPRFVDDEFTASDILTNCRQYPKDEAPAAYKDFDAVLDSVKAAGLATEVARLKARFVIKDAEKADD